MNGSDNNYQPSPDLPMPDKGAVNPIGAGQIPNQAVPAEKSATPAASTNDMPAQSGPLGPSPIAPPPLPSTPAPTNGSIPIPVNDASLQANDSDLIEKEWVSKAKYIVEATKNDPHLQNQEINKMKADYIQKRYNKQLKVSDD